MEMQRLWGTNGSSGVTTPFPGGKSAANTAAENAAKALRWGVSEMGLTLTIDGRDRPGVRCASGSAGAAGWRWPPPAGVNAGDLVAKIAQNFGHTPAVARGGDGSFVLDPAQLPNTTPNEVLDLLRATGNVLRGLGCRGGHGHGPFGGGKHPAQLDADGRRTYLQEE